MDGKYAEVRYVDFYKYNRVIVISDIHGDPESFTGVLKKTGFCDQDALVIVGDILGRGDKALELLQMVADYAEKGNLYMVKGNHDGILNEWYDGEITDEDIHAFITSGRNSIITEMADALKLERKTLDDTINIKEMIGRVFAREIAFLRNLPHIIDSSIAVFVHAGIRPGSLYEQDCGYCLTAKAFAEQEYCFEKPVIVGHWPASNYSSTVIDVNSYFNRNNTVSIDGGNSMKSWMQINYLIFDKNGTVIDNGYYDKLRRIKVMEAQQENADPITLIFPKTRIEVRKELETESVCYVPYLDRVMIFDNEHIYKYKGSMYCFDFTTYRLLLEAGETVSFCKTEGQGILIKRDGIVGMYYGQYKFVD